MFGYVNYGNGLNVRQIAAIYTSFSKACITRGAHACGIAYVANNELMVKKKSVDLVRAEFSYPWDVKILTAHCRLSLQKDYWENKNNHPFRGQTLDGSAYTLGHNGILRDLRTIRQALQLSETDIRTDSYLIAQILATKPRLDCQTLKEVCETLHGSFSFTVLDERNNLYLCRGDVPVYLVHFQKLKLYVYLSTRDLFEQAVKSTDLWHAYRTSNLEAATAAVNIVPLRKGGIVCISSAGELSSASFTFQEDLAISHNWYMHEITETEELKKQLEQLNNS
ncbi:MAG: hypothetical protein LBT22_04750 [Peptococcaceae bacterium]|jgi:glucosamine 6-phosphate synthetase-like amidotransferase/phosphosugar isomerase protein|nr:hypothetical protein [Peptococcaceae bacterium]